MALTDEVQVRRSYGAQLLSRGLYLAARDEFLRWLELVEGSGQPRLLIPPLNALATVAHQRGEHEEAWRYLQRALQLSKDQGVSRNDLVRVHLNLLMVATEQGRLDEAIAYSDGMPALSEGETGLQVAYWLNLSLLHWRRQEWIPMRQAARKAYERSVGAGDTVSTARAMTNLGIAHLELGADKLAERDLQRALRLSSDLGGAETAYVYAELGRLYYQRGDPQGALEAGRQALSSLLTHVGVLDKEEVARVSRLFGTIFAASGRRNLALKYLNRAAAYFSQLGFRPEWQRSTELIGQVLAAPAVAGRGSLSEEVQQLDFLTAVLDLTDDLESVDHYLRGHSERVAALALLLGDELRLSAEEMVVLSHSARLHDVGMVAVDAELLERDGPLTEAELRRVAMHTSIGEEMLRPYGLSAEGLRAVRHHHEYWNGSGSPDGLAGEEIPLLARLVAVADVYDSLTSERSYRGALSHMEAISQIREMAGSELDPVLVEKFVGLYEL